MRKRLSNLSIPLAAAACAASGCAALHAIDAPRTLPILEVASQPEKYRGQNVRCVTGRVAARDGSITLPEPGVIVVTSAPSSDPWYIHERCPARPPMPGRRQSRLAEFKRPL